MIEGFRIPLGDWARIAVDYVTDNLDGFFTFLRSVFLGMFDGVDFVLSTPPFWVVIAIAAIIAFCAKGWVFAILSAVGLTLIVGFDQWENAMDTLALILVASVIALVISIPIGILAAGSKKVSAVVRPILDLMQTMPAFVYLIPALLLFRVGVVPGIVATIIFALAPGVRLTELGIRGVDSETVEAGHAFGATPGQILRGIQLPLAMPTIMAGVNQVIMLALSMVVVAGLAGADGLGAIVTSAVTQLDIGAGFQGGLAVVILAIYLDRVTGALADPTSKWSWRRRRPTTDVASPEDAAIDPTETAKLVSPVR